jgi:hypothetical protein
LFSLGAEEIFLAGCAGKIQELMKRYIELNPVQKLKLLNEHALFVGAEWTHLDQRKWCLHCDAEFSGQSAPVYLEGGDVWLECGTAGCGGSPIDWAEEPWWRDEKKRGGRKKGKRKKG